MSGPSPVEKPLASVTSYLPKDEEIAPKKRFTALKISTLVILTSLVLGTLASGIALTVVLANPIFLALLIATVLFSVVTFLVYHQMTSKVSPDWRQPLKQNFEPLSEGWQENNVNCYSKHMFFYYNRLNPKFKLAIQRDVSQAFQPVFLTGLKVIPKGQSTGIIFNPVASTSGSQVSNNATNLSTVLYSNLNNKTPWEAGKHREGDSSQEEVPFLLTETRITQLPKNSLNQTIDRNLTGKEKESILPTFLGHVRGPTCDEFPEEKDVQEYYNRALLTYEHCLTAAIENHAAIAALPLFTSVYEVPSEETLPRKGFVYNPRKQMPALCKRALLDAIQNMALRYPQKSLLVVLQDPFNNIE
ncbi:hypothetical protein C10C_0478 [Chlamydia serpentis]|uniref:Macro domain-containing protein n=1 Tax=Chlamydia serpentis TaxID=1967782 RepID=A0A2R8FB27_9CHLA|nr:hypothetical protein [Chlamydia serpentis]SPN73643.1 hypothetical protein C10C_0478 [Chlamydia serpentis]